jgi:hypothetical protein
LNTVVDLRKYPVLAIVLTTSIFFRGFLWLLPGIGRDEALYWYWAHHPEFAYAPLIQLVIRIAEWLPFSPNLNIRFSSILAGSLVIVVMDLLLKERQASRQYRVLWGLVLGISPWMLYSGAIVHPDMWLVAMMLCFLYLIDKQRYRSAAFAAGMALWAKPTGLILVGFAILCWLWMMPLPRKTRLACLAITASTVLPVLAFANSDMIQGIREFAKIANAPSMLSVIVIQLLALIGLAGPALMWAVLPKLTDFGEAISRVIRDKGMIRDRHRQPAAVIGTMFFGAFLTAMIVNGQLKANWILPALLMPVLTARKLSYFPFKRSSISLAVVWAAGLLLLMTQPAFIKSVENSLPSLAQSYRIQAGSREAKVSAAAGWADRLNEYQSMQPFADSVKVYWQKLSPENALPVWILSDDYGLAAQLLFVWQSPETAMWITNDPLFRRDLPSQHSELFKNPGIMLQLYHDSRTDFPDLQPLLPVKWLPHPYATKNIGVGIFKQY